MNKSTTEQEQNFVHLIQQQHRLIYKVCNMYADSEEERKDLFQEMVLQAWKAFARFRGDAAISTWLYKVCLNTAVSYHRKRQRSPAISYPELLQQQPEDELSEADREQYYLLQQMIADLPRLDKALMLLYLEDKSYNEIADIMGISATNVGTRLNRIKDKMKQKAQILIKQ